VLRVAYRELLGHDDFTLNVSQEGLFIATEHAFAPGEEIEFEVSFPGLIKPIHLRAGVIWRRVRESMDDPQPAGIGVALRFESSVERTWLERLIARLKPAGRLAQEPQVQLRVLLAEDNPMTLDLIAEALREGLAGVECEVIVAAEAERALALLQREAFDLVMIELRMCCSGQGELIAALRDRLSRPEASGPGPAVVLAGADEQAPAAVQAVADVILRRPFPAKELLSTIRFLGLGTA
jgi:uncharacterized protein (TIGR02266 family)